MKGPRWDVSELPFDASRTRRAMFDLVEGALAFHLWRTLSWNDIRQRYRRSYIGPFWLTISMGFSIFILGMLYGRLFRADAASFVPFLALGFMTWAMLNSMVMEGCSVFTGARGYIQQMQMPLSTHILRMHCRIFLIFLHNFIIYIILVFIFNVRPGWAGLLAIPGFVLLVLNGFWVSLFLGMVAARYRDIPPILESVMRVAFFATPIIWTPDRWPSRAVVIEINPFYHALEIVRKPLLGQAPDAISWIVMLSLLAAGSLMTFAMFRKYRARIPFWI